VEWSSSEKLKFEKEALDFYFSSHPLAQHADDLRHFSTHGTDQLRELNQDQEIVIGGMITQIRLMTTKRPSRTGQTRYARCKIEDLHGSAEAVMWTDEFARYKDEFQEDRPCFVRAKVDRKMEEPMMVLQQIMSIETAKRELARGLSIQLRLGEHSPLVLDHIAAILQRARGTCPVMLLVGDGAGRFARLRLGEAFGVNPGNVAIRELEALVGMGRVRFLAPGSGRSGR
jgi:DNA polymerase-3 subunit alpha